METLPPTPDSVSSRVQQRHCPDAACFESSVAGEQPRQQKALQCRRACSSEVWEQLRPFQEFVHQLLPSQVENSSGTLSSVPPAVGHQHAQWAAAPGLTGQSWMFLSCCVQQALSGHPPWKPWSSATATEIGSLV